VQLGGREGCRRGAMGARPCYSFGSVRTAVPLLMLLLLLAWETGTRKRREREKKRKGRKRKEKKRKKIRRNMEKISNLKNFREKNKRQFMKLVKIIFVQERNNPNYN
jgi:hypothetical protein